MTGRTGGRGWAYAGAVLGGAVSVAANVAHSFVPPAGETDWQPQTGAVVGAVFWPVALFVAVEILARITWPAGRRWVALRYAGLLPVTAVAAVVSYRHLSGLLAFYKEDRLTALIGPLAVDGLMVMASSALVATAVRKAVKPVAEPDSSAETTPAPDAQPDGAADIAAGASPVSRPDIRRMASRTSRGSGTGTAAAVARAHRRHPEWSPAEIGRRLGVTDRTVRRHLAELRKAELSAPAGIETTSAASTSEPAAPAAA
jgi:HTH domain